MNPNAQLKDISDAEIIEAVFAHHEQGAPTPDLALADKYPKKVIIKKMARLLKRGVLEPPKQGPHANCCGVNRRGIEHATVAQPTDLCITASGLPGFGRRYGEI